MCPAHGLAPLSALPHSFQIVSSLAQGWWAVSSLGSLAPVGWAQRALPWRSFPQLGLTHLALAVGHVLKASYPEDSPWTYTANPSQ